jgi:hypothetical protein
LGLSTLYPPKPRDKLIFMLHSPTFTAYLSLIIVVDLLIAIIVLFFLYINPKRRLAVSSRPTRERSASPLSPSIFISTLTYSLPQVVLYGLS